MKIAIVGTAASAVLAPFDDPTWEIWGCAQNIDLPRWTRWFELHDDETLHSPENALYWEWLKQQTKPIHMSKRREDVPGSIAYPFSEITARFGTWFLTSTVAFMMAWAFLIGAKEIALYGVEMAQGGEYASQKPGARFFIQVARMFGIRVWAPKGCEVMEDGFLYAQPDQRLWLRDKAAVRRAELVDRIATLNSTHSEHLTKMLLLRGALEVKYPEEEIRSELARIAEADALLEREALVLNGALQDQDHVLRNWA